VHFTEEEREIKLVITALRNTRFFVYWYFEGNTDLHDGDVIVQVDVNVIFMYDDICNTMKSSTRIGVGGARPHN
jgi:hypothetical protein